MSLNNKLTQEIVRHIFANFGIIPSSHVNLEQSKLLIDPAFILPEKLTFTDYEYGDVETNIYGCEVNVANQKNFKVILGDCYEYGQQDRKGMYDYALIVHLKDAPTYGAFCSSGDLCTEPLLALNMDNKGWVPCTTYLQATFLAGMEQLKEISLNWNKCKKYDEELKALKSFIKFHDSLSEIT